LEKVGARRDQSSLGNFGVFSGQNHSSPEQVLSKLKGMGAKLMKLKNFFRKN
jgi:hypothetical protein